MLRERLATIIRSVVSFPGVQTIDGCPRRPIFELWPTSLPSLADAAILGVAIHNRYDAIATFDRKLAHQAKELGLRLYE